MYVKLDAEIIKTLCCPLCKEPLKIQDKEFICKVCASKYPSQDIPQGGLKDKVFDFRIHRPDYCMNRGLKNWLAVQNDYVNGYFERYTKKDDFLVFSNEVESLKEIYAKEFNIKGKVLDIGGGEGKLRQFIKRDNVPLYISVDPLINGFENFELRPNLLKAYPRLLEPCNFLACYAENLPFVKNTFDVVHIKSAMDHFSDPYLAIKEAYRVLKTGGILIISSTVFGGKSFSRAENRDTFLRRLVSDVVYKFRIGGFKNLIEAAINKALKKKGWATSHIFHWKYDDLIDLLHKNKFRIIKEHWQTFPLDMIVWLETKKII